MKAPFSFQQITSNEHDERNVVEQHESQSVIESLQPKARDMYIGFIRSHAWHEAMEDLYRGLVRHLKSVQWL